MGWFNSKNEKIEADRELRKREMEVFANIHRKKEKIENLKKKAIEREEALDYNAAIQIWEKLGKIKEAARVRRLKTEQKSVRVAQKVVKGNEINRTEIKDRFPTAWGRRSWGKVTLLSIPNQLLKKY